MKKFTAFVLAFIMCMNLAIPVSAASIQEETSSHRIQDMFEEAVANQSRTRSNPSRNCTAELTSDDGDAYAVEVFEYVSKERSAQQTQSKTYVFSTQPQYVTPRIFDAHQTNDGWDDSISVYGYVTITYDAVTQSNGTVYYLLSKVEGGWERDDQTVSMSNRYVAYTCQNVFVQDQITHKYPSSNTFSYNTGYTKSIADDSSTAVLGAQSAIDLAHGSSSKWTFRVVTNLMENDVGDFI